MAVNKKMGGHAQGANDSLMPFAPTIGTATNVGSGRNYNDGRADITFTAAGPYAATSYTVTSSPGGYTTTGASSPLTVTGLQSGTAYTFTVTATNSYGTSVASSASNSITATTLPQAPTIGTATNQGSGRPYNQGQVQVTFTANANGGAAIDSYAVNAFDTNGNYLAQVTGSSSPLTFTTLSSGGVYKFAAYSHNANGYSAASAFSGNVTVTTVPAAPAAPTASSPSAGNDTISWSAPADGGSAITSYVFSDNGFTPVNIGNVTSYNMAETQGSNHYFQVAAVNANGTGALSPASNTVTTTFSFAPFGFTPFGAFGAYGNFGAFGAYGNFGAFGAYGNVYGQGGFKFSSSINVNTEIIMYSVAGEPELLKPAGQLKVGDKLFALDLGPEPTNGDWRTWALSAGQNLSSANLVETEIVDIQIVPETKFIYIDGDLFSETHWILVKKDDVVKFIKSTDIDTTYQRYSYNTHDFVDIILVESLDLAMDKVSINCEPYDNFFTKQMLVKDFYDNKHPLV
jgi:hypothetical protein